MSEYFVVRAVSRISVLVCSLASPYPSFRNISSTALPSDLHRPIIIIIIILPQSVGAAAKNMLVSVSRSVPILHLSSLSEKYISIAHVVSLTMIPVRSVREVCPVPTILRTQSSSR